MSQYDNTNRGAVWPNKDKTTENHPDITGSINIEGKEYWLSGWERKPGANPKAPTYSLSVKAKEAVHSQGMQQVQQAQQAQQVAVNSINGPDDELPF